MSGLRSSRNLSAHPTPIRAGNPGYSLYFRTLGVETDPMVLEKAKPIPKNPNPGFGVKAETRVYA